MSSDQKLNTYPPFPNGYTANAAANSPTASPTAVCTIRIAMTTVLDMSAEVPIMESPPPEGDFEVEMLRPPAAAIELGTSRRMPTTCGIKSK